MADKKLSEEEQKQVEKIAEIVKMFRQIINEEGAVENNFYLQYLPAKSIDGMRSWMWIPFEQILDPEEAERFKKLRILLTDPIDVLLDVSKKATSPNRVFNHSDRKSSNGSSTDLTDIHRLVWVPQPSVVRQTTD